jgi:hypothetical protein
MTPAQRRRLEAVAAAVAPCLGCLRMDLVDLQGDTVCIKPDGGGAAVEAWKLAQRMERGLGTGTQSGTDTESGLERAVDEMMARRRNARRAALAERDRLQAILRGLLSTLPPNKRRDACPDCRARRQSRERCEAFAEQMGKALGRGPDTLGDDDIEGATPRGEVANHRAPPDRADAAPVPGEPTTTALRSTEEPPRRD